MKNIASNDAARGLVMAPRIERDMRAHVALLGHDKLGVTELRIFDPVPQVAYADDADAVVRLCLEVNGKTSGIHVSVQPRRAHLFDLATSHTVHTR